MATGVVPAVPSTFGNFLLGVSRGLGQKPGAYVRLSLLRQLSSAHPQQNGGSHRFTVTRQLHYRLTNTCTRTCARTHARTRGDSRTTVPLARGNSIRERNKYGEAKVEARTDTHHTFYPFEHEDTFVNIRSWQTVHGGPDANSPGVDERSPFDKTDSRPNKQ